MECPQCVERPQIAPKKDDGTTTFTYAYNVFGLMNGFDDGTNTATYQFYGSNWARSRSVVNGTTTKFYYDGDDVVAEGSAAATVTATYVTPGLDQNVSMTRGGSTHHYLRDGVGSIGQLLDSNEATQNSYDYYAFGAAYGSPTENVTSNYSYTGRRRDAEAGLHYYRWRMYDPVLGRFLSRDPSKPGSEYVYCLSDPVNAVDPEGLMSLLGLGLTVLGIFTILGLTLHIHNLVKAEKALQAALDRGPRLKRVFAAMDY